MDALNPTRIRVAHRSLKLRRGPSGIHLFNRATGANILLDECIVPEALWAPAPRHVSIALTNACDLSCPCCFAPKNSATLDFSLVTRWLKELDDNGCLGVGFGGGEPTLYPQLPELCHYAAAQTALAVTLTTHAHHFDEALGTALTGGVHFMRLSMDGVGATYEALRGRSFTAFCSRIRLIRKIAPFGINYLVNAATLPDLDAAVALAADQGAADFLLLPQQPVHGSGGVDQSVTAALQAWVAKYRGGIPLSVSEVGSAGLPTCNPCSGETGLRAYAHIDAMGTLRSTSFATTGVVIGSTGIIGALGSLHKHSKERSL